MIKISDLKKIIIPCLIVIILFCVISFIITKKELDKYNEIYNYNIECIVGEIRESYPNVDEKAIINILQNKDFSKQGKDLLKQYGYENMDYIESLNEQKRLTVTINILVIIAFGLTITFIILLYIARQNKKIEEINLYLKKVNTGKYNLKIEDNSEDELTKLRNELYKTTILLREAAENSRKESKNLSIALEDISHQLKTPLTSIRIMIDNLYENPDMDEETRKDFMNTISKQIEWISSLVISLLKLAKFDSGTIVMNSKETNVKKLIDEVIDNLSILLDIKNIQIQKDIPENATIKIDYKWQLEALTNIVKNSIEHSKDDPKIDIKVEDSSVLLKIIITDYGEGISKKDINHIFERFYKTENSSENSMGIGLALSKTIIEKENGYISVKSKEGVGTRFIIKYIK